MNFNEKVMDALRQYVEQRHDGKINAASRALGFCRRMAIFFYPVYILLYIFFLTNLHTFVYKYLNSDGEREQPAGEAASSGKRRSYPRYPLGMAAPASGCGSKRGPAASSKEDRGTTRLFPIWKQPRKDGLMKNLGIHFNRLQFVTNWIFDISAPETRERGESDNIAARVRQARDLPAWRAIPTDARNKPRFYQRNCRGFLGSSER